MTTVFLLRSTPYIVCTLSCCTLYCSCTLFVIVFCVCYSIYSICM